MSTDHVKAGKDRGDVAASFDDAVNMTPSELEKWLETDHSREVGWKEDGSSGESVGHQSGRRIVEITRKKAADRTDDDVAHMLKVVSYVHRHIAQRPDGDIRDTRWRYSLMNWGDDPLK